jgi:hypothetical protein
VAVHVAAVSAVHAIGHSVYGALPADTFERTWEEKEKLIASQPLGALVIVVAAWTAGALAGGYVAARIAGFAPYVHAGVIGALDLLGIALMARMLPHPDWMLTAGPACVILATLTAAWLAQSANPGGGETRGEPTLTPG